MFTTDVLVPNIPVSFFSCLAALRRKEQGLLGMSLETEEDKECLVKDTERQELLDEIVDEVGRKYPIIFDRRISPRILGDMLLLLMFTTFENIITRTNHQLLTFKYLKAFSRILKYHSSPKIRRRL